MLIKLLVKALAPVPTQSREFYYNSALYSVYVICMQRKPEQYSLKFKHRNGIVYQRGVPGKDMRLVWYMDDM